MKDIKGKPKLRLIPKAAMEAIAKVREYGIRKYGDDVGWKNVDPIDFIDASIRHIYKYLDGQIVDEESGLPHIHHALTSLALASADIGDRKNYYDDLDTYYTPSDEEKIYAENFEGLKQEPNNKFQKNSYQNLEEDSHDVSREHGASGECKKNNEENEGHMVWSCGCRVG